MAPALNCTPRGSRPVLNNKVCRWRCDGLKRHGALWTIGRSDPQVNRAAVHPMTGSLERRIVSGRAQQVQKQRKVALRVARNQEVLANVLVALLPEFRGSGGIR